MTLFWGLFVFFNYLANAQVSSQRSDSSLFLATEKIWNSTAVDNVKISTLISSTQGTYRLPLTVVIDKNSPWTIPFVTEFIRNAEIIFTQCDLALAPITVIELNHPQLADFTPSTDYLITRDFPQNNYRPLVVFNNGSYGSVYANAEYYKDHNFESLTRNTAFVDYLALGFHSSTTKESYFLKTVIAHELLHLLLNAPHNQLPGNILSSVQKGESVSLEQCDKVLKNDLVKRL